MDEEDFEPYLGKELQVGVPNYADKDRLFMHNGLLTKVTPDGIILKSPKKEVFLRYGIIQYYSPSGVAGE